MKRYENERNFNESNENWKIGEKIRKNSKLHAAFNYDWFLF